MTDMDRQQALIEHFVAKPGLRGKVNAFCISCIYDQKSGMGSWRQQVEACTAPKCPLYSVRPTSTVKADEEADEPQLDVQEQETSTEQEESDAE